MTDSICILPNTTGLGGPASFQSRLIAGLHERSIPVHHNPDDPSCKAILVIGGTRHLDLLFKAKRRGIRIVQRLNGMNWIHRKKNTGLVHYLRSEWGNWLLATIRRHLADEIIYQSQFARTWWQTVHGQVNARGQVIFNGVDLKIFTPTGEHHRPQDSLRLLVVEGHLRGGYEMGLETALELVRMLAPRLKIQLELMVAGDVDPELKEWAQSRAAVRLTWAGVVPRAEIPVLDRSAHLLFSADLNAACPNSVIEALACGLPVVAYATGSLPELLSNDAGRVANYGTNYWNLEPPVIDYLVMAAETILQDEARFRQAARARAEAAFGLETMVSQYVTALLG
ncbi:MAG TPA: glycosyltransferase family 4 protein [Anaerolineaceae bacterium]|nr:glycosyltransferase family 4 protein [Anaerolineaceae bacterium]